MRVRLAGLLFLIGCQACTRGGSGYFGTTEPKHGPDEVWTNLGVEPEYIDPGKASEIAGGTIIVNTFASLTQSHPVTLEPMPEIAQSWEISQDGTRYTFHLRPSRWSDGTPLTAADFVYSWLRLLSPENGSKYANFMYPVRYAEMFSRRAVIVRGVGALGEAELERRFSAIAPIDQLRMAPELDAAFAIVGGPDPERPALRQRLIQALVGQRWEGSQLRAALVDGALVGVRALDDLTLQVDLENALPYFLHIVKFYVSMPVPRHVIERLAKAGQNPDLWTRPEHIVSNGPYVLEQAKFRQFMRLRKNPRYWDAEHVRIERVRLTLTESYNTTLNLYEAGELDSIGSTVSLPAEFIDTLKRQKDFRRAPYLAAYFYWVNTRVPPLDDPRVRDALRMAIDRSTIVEHVTRAGQLPNADLVPDGLAGYKGLRTPVFDPERARQLLREAGYGPDRPLPPITLTYNTAETHKQIAEAVQAMWREHLGVRIELENQEWTVFLKTMRSGQFQLARYGWIGDYPDPYTFLELLSPHSGNNNSGWSEPKYEELLQRANRTRDPLARLDVLRQAEQLAMRAVPMIPIYTYTRSEMVKPYLMGHALNYENRHLFKYWWIDERWYDGIPNDRLDDRFPPSPQLSAEGG
jgi:oligopeptide transport system substrate-binding protein